MEDREVVLPMTTLPNRISGEGGLLFGNQGRAFREWLGRAAVDRQPAPPVGLLEGRRLFEASAQFGFGDLEIDAALSEIDGNDVPVADDRPLLARPDI